MKQASYYYQCPPTGIYPQALVSDLELSWVYDVYKTYDWIPSPSKFRYYGAVVIQDVYIEAPSKNGLIDVVHEIINKRHQDGTFGIWSRNVTRFLDGNYSSVMGFFWHPAEEILSQCQANIRCEKELKCIQEQQERNKQSHTDLSWHRLVSLEELLEKIPKINC